MELNLDLLDQNNYIILDDFVSRDISMALYNQCLSTKKKLLFKNAKIGKNENHHLNQDIRSDSTFWLSPDNYTKEEQLFFQELNQLMHEVNRKFYLGLKSFEAHYAYYPKNSFYKKHLDTHLINSPRRLTFIHYLNPKYQSHDGGELVIYFENQKSIKIEPVLGRTVFFFSEILPHEVLTSQKDRFSLTGWCRTDLL